MRISFLPDSGISLALVSNHAMLAKYLNLVSKPYRLSIFALSGLDRVLGSVICTQTSSSRVMLLYD